ncbi:MAG: glycosyltransferase family 4 protein [Verrucomicrobiales bacterium]
MDKKYRILLVIRWPVGGIRTFIRYVFRNFECSRYQFTILAPEGPELSVLLEDLEDLDVVSVSFKNDSSRLNLMALLIKTILFGNFDLIHSHGFMSGIFSALPACLSRTRHIMTSHDVLLSKQFLGLKGFLKKTLLSLFLPMIDIIHSVSQDAYDNLLEYVPRLKKRLSHCILIPNGIEVERFKGSERDTFRKQLNLPEETFLIGFLGRFMSQKGFIYLIEALGLLLKKENLPKTPVILAFGFGGFIREDKCYIEEKGLERHFHFLPFMSNISSALRGLDVIAMPSLWEACPLLPMEAMVAGVPLIGTDCFGLREVLKDTPNKMVPAGDGVALATAICQEIISPSKLKATMFRDEASRRFDVRHQAKKLEAVMLGLIRS